MAQSSRKVHKTLLLDPAMVKTLQKIAKLEERSLSQMIRILLRNGIEAWQEGVE